MRVVWQRVNGGLRHRLARTVVILLVGVAILAIAPIAIFQSFDRWSRVCCKLYEINIKTGQIRHSRYLYFRQLGQEVEDTALSKALAGDTVDAAPIDPWQPISVFSPSASRYSPHCVFHNAPHVIRAFEAMCKKRGLTDQEKHKAAEGILRQWQKDGRSIGVDMPFMGLQDLNEQNECDGPPSFDGRKWGLFPHSGTGRCSMSGAAGRHASGVDGVIPDVGPRRGQAYSLQFVTGREKESAQSELGRPVLARAGPALMHISLLDYATRTLSTGRQESRF